MWKCDRMGQKLCSTCYFQNCRFCNYSIEFLKRTRSAKAEQYQGRLDAEGASRFQPARASKMDSGQSLPLRMATTLSTHLSQSAIDRPLEPTPTVPRPRATARRSR